MDEPIFNTSPTIKIGNATFIKVPILLQVEDTPLIEVIHQTQLGFTTRFSVFDADGNDIARVTGARVYPTTKGQETGILIDKQSDVWVCKRGQDTIFEIQQSKDNLTIRADLYTPAGTLVKMSDGAPQFFDLDGQNIKINGNTSGGTVTGVDIGLHLYADGQLVIGQMLKN